MNDPFRRQQPAKNHFLFASSIRRSPAVFRFGGRADLADWSLEQPFLTRSGVPQMKTGASKDRRIDVLLGRTGVRDVRI